MRDARCRGSTLCLDTSALWLSTSVAKGAAASYAGGGCCIVLTSEPTSTMTLCRSLAWVLGYQRRAPLGSPRATGSLATQKKTASVAWRCEGSPTWVTMHIIEEWNALDREQLSSQLASGFGLNVGPIPATAVTHFAQNRRNRSVEEGGDLLPR